MGYRVRGGPVPIRYAPAKPGNDGNCALNLAGATTGPSVGTFVDGLTRTYVSQRHFGAQPVMESECVSMTISNALVHVRFELHNPELKPICDNIGK